MNTPVFPKSQNFILACLTASITALSAQGGLPADQVARLSGELTPFGAIRAGNADGSIPAWTGGITTPPSGYKVGDHHPDPFAEDQPIAIITAANLDQYKDRLTAGHLALFATYPESFRMPLYPSRRSASVPQEVYDQTIQIASTASLTPEGTGVTGAIKGIPFPIPQNGQEAIWNHILRYRGVSLRRVIGQATPTRQGSYNLVTLEEDVLINFFRSDVTEAEAKDAVSYLKQTITAPARLAGSILLVHETMDQVAEPRRAWTYNPGQRRVRRAPNVAYDNPGTASDGLRTTDQFDMFNGAPDRYDWTLVGRKEMIVPYNSYRLHSNQLKVSDIVKALHLNPEHTRYELHRVWVVEAKLKDGLRHQYSRRTFYIDEDSWQILVADQYDGRGELWRVSEAHCVNYYEVPVFWSTLETHIDLFAGRYLVLGLKNDGPMIDFGYGLRPGDFTPDALRREGVR
jgi:hypothetical protein